MLYRAQGRYDEAEPRFKRALAISEKTLGLDHPDVATSLNNLAVFYEHQGRYAEALLASTRAVNICSKNLSVSTLLNARASPMPNGERIGSTSQITLGLPMARLKTSRSAEPP
jgi:tetratricopeptide (TPR) repeat protein